MLQRNIGRVTFVFERRRLLLNSRCCILVAAIALAGCATTIEQRGHLPAPDRLAEIHPGKTTRDQVRKILGTPSSVGVFDDDSWYYISRRTSQLAFLDPDVIDQKVYIVRFDKAGVVTAIDKRGLKDGREITPVARTTPARGRELTFMEQLIGNIGRFNGASPIGTNPAGPGGP
jgi:outer membrane protein assembly factor BamE (lipoprotein component of BamABCDE complex)